MYDLNSVALSLWLAMAAPVGALYGALVANNVILEDQTASKAPMSVVLLLAAATFAVVLGAAGWVEALSALLLMSVLAYLSVFDLRFMAAPIAPILVGCVAGVAIGFATDMWLGVERMLAMCAGWATFALLAAIYERWRGRMGLGGADALVAALLGAWLSFEGLAWSVAFGGALGLLWALTRGADRAIPFIPALCGGVVLYSIGRGLLA